MLGLEDWENGVLTNNYMKCYYSIIPPFHYSRLEYAEWLDGNSILSTIFRISDI